MRAWPHSGFQVHDAMLVPDGDMAFALRLARDCARTPVALERLEYDANARQVRYRSDQVDGPRRERSRSIRLSSWPASPRTFPTRAR
jgi:hypothetical protein